MGTEYGWPLQIAEVKAHGDAWSVEGYVSSYGNIDHGGDVVMRGAFDNTLAGAQPVRFLYAHRTDQVLGLPLELRSDDKGLFGRFKISKTQLGTDIHTLLQDKALDSFSIGYVPTDVEFDDVGNRLLKSVDLLECSVVAMPMNERAVVTNVKSDEKMVWTGSFVNDLPDSAFAVILPGGKKDADGKTTPRSLRKLPHHGSDGKVDLPHLRNAISREPQSDMSDSAHSTARGHLNRHAKSEGVGNGGKDWGDLDDDVPFEELLAQVKGYLLLSCDEAEALAARRSDIGRKLAAGHHDAIQSLLREAEACAQRLDRLLVDATEAKARDADGDLMLRLELARRLEARSRELALSAGGNRA